MSDAKLSVSESLANFLLNKFLRRFPVKGARVVFGLGWMELHIAVPILGSFKTRLYPLEPTWGERKALRFRVEEAGGVSLVKTAVQFLKEGIRFDGEVLEVDIDRFWERLPEELRWGAKVSRLEFKEKEALLYLENA